MDKRYQVFVSSTYADLKQERQHVIQALMEMDCIPAGMELFPAADEEQWHFIKRVIDDCDYYMVIIGGRYGSTTADGVSYTEKEYDYAVEKGLKVVALLHEKPDSIEVGKSDIDPELRTRLNVFREKITAGRLVKYWTQAKDLPGLVALSLSKTIKMFPAVGWVRANAVANTDLLSELNELRKENNLLNVRIKEIEQQPLEKVEGLADLDVKFTIHGKSSGRSGFENWQKTLTWSEIFAYIAPYLLQFPNADHVKTQLTNTLVNILRKEGFSHQIDDQEFQTISIQLKALGLIYIKYSETVGGRMDLFWSLTPQGDRLMMMLRTIIAPK